MKLWKISQMDNDSYDTYDRAIVVAATEEEARVILPDEHVKWGKDDEYSSWAHSSEKVMVEYIGEAASHLKAGTVVLASFNAG